MAPVRPTDELMVMTRYCWLGRGLCVRITEALGNTTEESRNCRNSEVDLRVLFDMQAGMLVLPIQIRHSSVLLGGPRRGPADVRTVLTAHDFVGVMVTDR